MGGKSSKPIEQNKPKSFDCREMINRIKIDSIKKEYIILEELGKGTYGSVFKAKSNLTNKINALKVVNKKRTQFIERMLTQEFRILREDHPNIIKMLEFFQDSYNYYIVTELIDGKELYEVFAKKKKFNQRQAFQIFYQLCFALVYLRNKNIMHRDIKLQNVIYSQKNKLVKLLDFGSATTYESDQPCALSRLGSVHMYKTPEVIKRLYNYRCDVWSLGVLLYIMISGNAPFCGKTNEEIYSKILHEDLTFYKTIWESISVPLKHLISQMLIKDPDSRISLSQIMKHQWVTTMKETTSQGKDNHQFIIGTMHYMMKFKELKIAEIQIGILVFMVNFVCTIKDSQKMMKAFNVLDQKADGVICEEELTNALEMYLDLPINKSKIHAKTIMDKIDFNHNKSLDYSEYLVAATDLKTILSKQNLYAAFHYIDTDGSQALSIQQIQAKLGNSIPFQAYERLLNHFNKDQKGQINLTQFMSIMLKLTQNY